MHYKNMNKTYREKTKSELSRILRCRQNKKKKSNLDATFLKPAAVRPPTYYPIIHPSKTNKNYGV